ncbi:glycoside hydrolase family 28 protein [Swingsia samuiensis]|uniref:Polygalacturonase n=1 Tax=Swingsia samuiensis TaxID=1293412 RepID=A0A4Y6UHM1_9PROT|nr:glycosyl hydrolase family 28 protein [Swingsia samuiensis]QDH16310.1 polygalacturonase [Swingsia samuiensis]
MMMFKSILPSLCFLTVLQLSGLGASASAQDRRDVKPPSWPRQICAELVPADVGRLQSVLDDCPSGSALRLRHGRFVSAPLTVTSGVFLWVDQDATLVATSDPLTYDRGTGLCGKLDEKGNACRPFLLFQHTRGGGLIGKGTIEGQGDKPMFGSSLTWWQLARSAQNEDLKQNAPRLITLDHVRDFTLGYITIKNSPNFHVVINQSAGVTLWGVTIDTPADARNTDGIDPISSHDITIAHSIIRTGDDNIAIKAGRSGASHHMSILDSQFYWGHGLSIGSETMGGVHDILVKDVTIDGAKWGVRIKSNATRGGKVEHIVYENLYICHTPWPIFLDTHYDQKDEGSDIPLYKDILFKNINIDSGTVYIHGYDENNLSTVSFENLVTQSKVKWSTEYAHISK